MGDEEHGGEKFENSLKQRQDRRAGQRGPRGMAGPQHVYLAVLAAVATRRSLSHPPVSIPPRVHPRSYRLFF